MLREWPHWDLPGGGPLGGEHGVLTWRKWKQYVWQYQGKLPEGVVALSRSRFTVVSSRIPLQRWCQIRTRQDAEAAWRRIEERYPGTKFKNGVSDMLMSGGLKHLQWPIVRCLMGSLAWGELARQAKLAAARSFGRCSMGEAVYTATGIKSLAKAAQVYDAAGLLSSNPVNSPGCVATDARMLAQVLGPGSPLGRLVAEMAPTVRVVKGAVWLDHTLFTRPSLVHLFVMRVQAVLAALRTQSRGHLLCSVSGVADFVGAPDGQTALVKTLAKMIPEVTFEGGTRALKPLDAWPHSLVGLRSGVEISDQRRLWLGRVYGDIALCAGLRNEMEVAALLTQLCQRVVPSRGSEGRKYKERSAALMARAIWSWKSRVNKRGLAELHYSMCSKFPSGLPIACGVLGCTGCVLAELVMASKQTPT